MVVYFKVITDKVPSIMLNHQWIISSVYIFWLMSLWGSSFWNYDTDRPSKYAVGIEESINIVAKDEIPVSIFQLHKRNFQRTISTAICKINNETSCIDWSTFKKCLRHCFHNHRISKITHFFHNKQPRIKNWAKKRQK